MFSHLQVCTVFFFFFSGKGAIFSTSALDTRQQQNLNKDVVAHIFMEKKLQMGNFIEKYQQLID